jgi:PAS domain S-box-containing protein
VAENVGDFIWEVDAKGLYRYTSPSVERILGYTPDELVGKKHFYDLFAPDVREDLKTAAFKVFATKEAFRAFSNPNVSKQGAVVYLETSGVPVLDADGNLAGYRGADTDISERKRAEEALRESERVLRQNENDLRRLAGRLISAHEEERSRVARELHDDLAQRLAVFAIDVGKLEKQLMDPPAPVQEELLEMKKDIVRISQDVHSLSRQLHPSILDDLGLIKAVESECTNFSRREGIDIVFNHENISTVIPKDVSLSLYRIIQEGLRNISKHACAEHISVSLRGMDHDVLLSVQDDGIGFDSAEVKEKPGLGLSSMRERVRLIQGELSIKSQPEKGTVITVRVPLTREGE